MTFAALDLNTNRAWAISGAAGQSPQVVHLDGDHPELPLVLSLQKRTVEIGRAGLGLCRKSPQLVCQDFLPRLGREGEWRHGRHHLDAARALGLVFHKVRKPFARMRGMVLAVPGYLTRDQIRQLAKQAQDTGLPVTGAISRVLAAGLGSYAEHPWHHLGVVLDTDDHALSCSVLRADETELRSLGQRVLPMLGLRLWKERLLGWIADQCIRTCRRDPRESPDAEQMLYDQLDEVLDLCSQNQPVPLRVQGTQWFLNLTLPAAGAAAACAGLAQRVAAEVHTALLWAEQQLTGVTIYLTAGAARLPGLAAAVYQRCQNRAPVVMLPPAAPARAALELAVRIDQGELAPGILDPAVPLPHLDRRDPPAVLPFPEHLTRAAY